MSSDDFYYKKSNKFSTSLVGRFYIDESMCKSIRDRKALLEQVSKSGSKTDIYCSKVNIEKLRHVKELEIISDEISFLVKYQNNIDSRHKQRIENRKKYKAVLKIQRLFRKQRLKTATLVIGKSLLAYSKKLKLGRYMTKLAIIQRFFYRVKQRLSARKKLQPYLTSLIIHCYLMSKCKLCVDMGNFVCHRATTIQSQFRRYRCKKRFTSLKSFINLCKQLVFRRIPVDNALLDVDVVVGGQERSDADCSKCEIDTLLPLDSPMHRSNVFMTETQATVSSKQQRLVSPSPERSVASRLSRSSSGRKLQRSSAHVRQVKAMKLKKSQVTALEPFEFSSAICCPFSSNQDLPFMDEIDHQEKILKLYDQQQVERQVERSNRLRNITLSKSQLLEQENIKQLELIREQQIRQSELQKLDAANSRRLIVARRLAIVRRVREARESVENRIKLEEEMRSVWESRRMKQEDRLMRLLREDENCAGEQISERQKIQNEIIDSCTRPSSSGRRTLSSRREICMFDDIYKQMLAFSIQQESMTFKSGQNDCIDKLEDIL